MPDFTSDSSSVSRQRALIGAGVVAAAAAAGAAAFLLGRRMEEHDTGEIISDAPPHVFRGKAREKVEAEIDETLVGRTVTIGRPRGDIYQAWRDFTRFPSFMENVEEVEDLGKGRSRWRIKGPGGKDVELVTQLVEDVPNARLAWESDDASDIETSGLVELTDAPPGRGTYVRLMMSYDAPGGAIGRGIAKLLQREPSVQARRDLRRFKQLMETGEVSTNASPSARSSETPTEARI